MEWPSDRIVSYTPVLQALLTQRTNEGSQEVEEAALPKAMLWCIADVVESEEQAVIRPVNRRGPASWWRTCIKWSIDPVRQKVLVLPIWTKILRR